MDKLRREAERSGDSLRCALELRRQGQDLRAKRLIQDLAWDKHPGAEEALDQLYPFSDRLTKQLERLQGSRRDCFFAASELVGSLDPRVNALCRTAMLQWEDDESAQPETRDFFKKWIAYLDEKHLPSRLGFAPRNLAKALKWAEVLPEELPEIVEEFRASQLRFGVANLGPANEIMLAWHIEKAGMPELLPKVLERFEAINWRDRQLLAKGSEQRRLETSHEIPRSPWGPEELSPLERYDLLSGAYLRSVFVDSKTGEPGQMRSWAERRNWTGDLILLNINRMTEINDHYGFYAGDLAVQEMVGLWQDCVGDRVIRWSANDYIVLWELGSVNELLTRMIESTNNAPWMGSSPKPTFTMGATPFLGDWFEAVERARAQRRQAREQNLPFIPVSLRVR
ncbi:MAG: hypothetical protein P1V97_29520 [Planctomycetota bacterium]|nr:hypothetical protein [Planctomycetota bacterium]